MPSDANTDPVSRSAVPPQELTDTELRLERDKLAIEREMLALERERWASERDQWKAEREWNGQASTGLHVSVVVLGLAVAVALLLGGLMGFDAGLRTGRAQAPLPRHVVVGQQFLQLLARTQGLPPPTPATTPGFDFLALYRRPPDTRAAGNLPLVR